MSDLDTAPDPDMPAIPPPDDGGSEVESRESGDADEAPYRRVINENTRKLFQGAAKSIADQIADGAGDDEVPAIPPPNAPPAAAAATTAPSASGSQVVIPPNAAAAAAPAIDAATKRKELELDVREKSLADREAAIGAREKSSATIDSFATRYGEGAAATVRELVAGWTGADGDSLKDEVADLISDLTENVLGLPVSPEIKTRIESRRALRTVKAYKAEQAKKDAEAAKRAETERADAEHRARERLAVDALGTEFGKKEIAGKYPHLMLEDAPHEIVWDVIKTKAAREPAWAPNWEEAATLADNHFRAQHDKQRAKLNRLPTPANTPAAAAAPQGAVQSRTARALTNAGTAPIPPAEPVADDEPYDRDRSRRRSLGKLQAALKERTT